MDGRLTEGSMQEHSNRERPARAHLERLTARYPALAGCRGAILRAYETLRDCYMQGGKLLLAGNGGSCADCAHIAGELLKGFHLKRPLPKDMLYKLHEALDGDLPGAAALLQQGLPAIDLTAHTALMTAVANDMDASLAMAQQVLAYGKKGDVVLGISTSGNAKNVVAALLTGKALGLRTLALTGGDGGRLAEICELAIIAPASKTDEAQELHLPVYHALCAMLEARFFA